MKKTIWSIIGTIGFFLMLAGFCAIDSEDMMIPAIMGVVGLILLCACARATMPVDDLEE